MIVILHLLLPIVLQIFEPPSIKFLPLLLILFIVFIFKLLILKIDQKLVHVSLLLLQLQVCFLLPLQLHFTVASIEFQIFYLVFFHPLLNPFVYGGFVLFSGDGIGLHLCFLLLLLEDCLQGKAPTLVVDFDWLALLGKKS